jgi:hypothetical protein
MERYIASANVAAAAAMKARQAGRVTFMSWTDSRL